MTIDWTIRQCRKLRQLEPLAQRRQLGEVGFPGEGEGWRASCKWAASVCHFLRFFLQLGWSLSPNRVVSLPVGVLEPFAQQCVL